MTALSYLVEARDVDEDGGLLPWAASFEASHKDVALTYARRIAPHHEAVQVTHRGRVVAVWQGGKAVTA